MLCGSCGGSPVCRGSASQAEGRGFEPRPPPYPRPSKPRTPRRKARVLSLSRRSDHRLAWPGRTSHAGPGLILVAVSTDLAIPRDAPPPLACVRWRSCVCLDGAAPFTLTLLLSLFVRVGSGVREPLAPVRLL